jgi:ribosome-binding ATPase YchF (GTP1/OBG family)
VNECKPLVDGKVDPLNDICVINFELAMADLAGPGRRTLLATS